MNQAPGKFSSTSEYLVLRAHGHRSCVPALGGRRGLPALSNSLLKPFLGVLHRNPWDMCGQRVGRLSWSGTHTQAHSMAGVPDTQGRGCQFSVSTVENLMAGDPVPKGPGPVGSFDAHWRTHIGLCIFLTQSHQYSLSENNTLRK